MHTSLPLRPSNAAHTYKHIYHYLIYSSSQEFFRSKGWENKPIRCEPCRKARKAQDNRGGYNQGGGYGQNSFGGGAFGSRGGAGGGGRSCYNCGKARIPSSPPILSRMTLVYSRPFPPYTANPLPFFACRRATCPVSAQSPARAARVVAAVVETASSVARLATRACECSPFSFGTPYT